MTFDVFGDFESRGYLRNTAGLKDPVAVKQFEHRAYVTNLNLARDQLKQLKQITYRHVLDTHRILFQDIYPWAGQDRRTTAPNIGISRGGRDDLFAHPEDSQFAVEYALQLGQDKFHMAKHTGEVMGYLAHAHPFLDGNGRTILVVHTELAHRAGIRIEWRKTEKTSYLETLTRELDRPGRGELDDYLKPFVGPAMPEKQASAMLAKLRGLGPGRPR